MAYTSNLKPQIDLPVWEWTRFAPVANAAAYTLAADEEDGGRYIYYQGASVFYRYDTVTDGWQYLSPPHTAVATVAAMKYSTYGGYRGNVLDAAGASATIAAPGNTALVGKIMRITDGTGEGQERTITAVGPTQILDHGVATSAASSFVSDSTKKWEINQYIGCLLRLTYGTGQTQIRKILYHNENTLVVSDVNYQQLDPWNNTVFASASLSVYALPAANTFYTIEQVEVVLDSPWTTPPDASSSYMIRSGSLWTLTTAAVAAGAGALQYYDVLSDSWQIKTGPGSHLLAALGTEVSIERTGVIGGVFDSGSITSSGFLSMESSAASWDVDRWANYQVRVVHPSDGQIERRRIVGNTATKIFVNKPWDHTISASSTYQIYANVNEIYLVGNNSSSTYKYQIEEDQWVLGAHYDSGQARNISVSYAGQEAFAVSTGTVNASGITSVASAPTNGGLNYTIGDILTISTGGTLGKVRVENIATGGIVTEVSLYACGINYTTGSGKATTGGVGTGCTVEILTIANSTPGHYVGKLTLVQNHNLVIGDTITLTGAAGTSNWNGTYSIIGCDAWNVMEIDTLANASITPVVSSNLTTLVDSSKNWIVNEHVGKVLNYARAGTAPEALVTSTFSRVITANTQTSLTFQAGSPAASVPTNGTTRYTIEAPEAFGRAVQYRNPDLGATGWATTGTATSLTDSTKSWTTDQWAQYKMRILTGPGIAYNPITITSNTSDTLVCSAMSGFVPDTDTKYQIMDTFGIAASGNTTTIYDYNKRFIPNSMIGKRVRVVAGTGQGNEVAITAVASTTLTVAAMTVAPDTTTCYTILDPAVRGASCCNLWIYGNTNQDTRGRYIYVGRGGGVNAIDAYDIPSDTFNMTIPMYPQSEAFTTGGYWAYDGGNRIYVSQCGTGSSRVYSLDVDTLMQDTAGSPPYQHGAAVLGNRMEIVTTADGVKYIYIMRHSGQEMWRSLLYW